jgi:hypothetical protein
MKLLLKLFPLFALLYFTIRVAHAETWLEAHPPKGCIKQGNALDCDIEALVNNNDVPISKLFRDLDEEIQNEAKKEISRKAKEKREREEKDNNSKSLRQ